MAAYNRIASFDILPRPPTNPLVSAVTANSITVSFTPINNTAFYIITAVPVNGGTTIQQTTPVNASSYQLTGLASNTQYSISVTTSIVTNKTFNSPYSSSFPSQNTYSSFLAYYKFNNGDVSSNNINIVNYAANLSTGGALVYDASLSVSGLVNTTSGYVPIATIPGNSGYLQLSGTSTKYFLATTLPAIGTSGLGITTWVNTTYKQYQTIIEYGNGAGNDNIILGIDCSGYLFSYDVSGVPSAPILTALSDISYSQTDASSIDITISNDGKTMIKAVSSILPANTDTIYYSTNFASVLGGIPPTWTRYSSSINHANITSVATNYDATKMVFSTGTDISSSVGGYCYYVNGINGTVVKTGDTTQRNWRSIAMTPDATKLVGIDSSYGYVGYATWNGTNYSSFQTIGDTLSSGTGIDITADGSKIVYCNSTTIKYALWNVTSYDAGTSISLSSSGTFDKVKFSPDTMVIYASNSSSSSSALAYSYWNGSSYTAFTNSSMVAPYANTTKTLFAINPIDGKTIYLSGLTNPLSFNNTHKFQANYPNSSYMRNANSIPVNDGYWHKVQWGINANGIFEYIVDGSINAFINQQYINPSVVRGINYYGKSTIWPYSNLSGGIDDLNIITINNNIISSPTDLIATTTDTTSVTLSFTDNSPTSNSNTYSVVAIPSSGDLTKVVSSSYLPPNTGYTVSNLTSGTDYSMNLVLFNGFNSSSNVSTQITTVCSAPTITSVTGLTATNNTPTLNLTDSSTTVKTKNFNYKLSNNSASPSVTDICSSVIATGSIPQIQTSALLSGTDYSATVSITNNSGFTSAPSSDFSFTTYPTAPGISSIVPDLGSVQFTLADTSTSSASKTYQRSDLSYNNSVYSAPSNLTGAGSNTVTGLSSGTDYSMNITTTLTNSSTLTSIPTTISFTTTPSAPTVSAPTMTISGANFGPVNTTVYSSGTLTYPYTTIQNSGTNRSQTTGILPGGSTNGITGLVAGTDYSFNITASLANTRSGTLVSSVVNLSGTTIPVPPAMTVAPQTDISFIASYSDPESSNTSTIFAKTYGYNLYRISGINNTKTVNNLAGSSITITDVSGGTDYSFNMFTKLGASMQSTNSSDISFTTWPAAPSLVATTVSNNSFLVNFNDSSTTLNPRTYTYDVYIESGPVSLLQTDICNSSITATIAGGNSNTSNINFTNLSGGTDYSFNLTTSLTSQGMLQTSSTLMVPITTVPDTPVISSVITTISGVNFTLSDTSTTTAQAPITYQHSDISKNGTTYTSAAAFTPASGIYGLTSGTDYSMNITTKLNNDSTSAPASIFFTTVPDAPTNIAITTSSTTSEVLSLTAPYINSYSTPTYNYLAHPTSGPSSSGTSSDVNSTGLTFASPITITDLQAGTDYSFNVQTALNGLTSTYSNIVGTTVPDAPILSYSSSDLTSVQFTLSDTTTTSTKTKTYKYTDISRNGTVTAPVALTGSSPFTVSGLSSGTDYSMNVTTTLASTPSVTSAASTTMVFTTKPNAPVLSAPSLTVSGGTVPFTPPTTNSYSTPTYNYSAHPTSGSSADITSSIASSPITFTGTLQPGTDYSFNVQTSLNSQLSAYAVIVGTTSPDAPSNVSAATIVSDTSFQIVFTDSSTSTKTKSYNYSLSKLSGTKNTTTSTLPANNIFTGVSGGTDFSFNMYTTLNSVNSARSVDISFTTIPSPPTVLVAPTAYITNSVFDISFTDTSTTSKALSYNYIVTSTSGPAKTITGSQNGPPGLIIVSNLSGGTDYSMNMTTSIPSLGYTSRLSNSVVVTTKPNAPTNLAIPLANITNSGFQFQFSKDNTSARSTSYNYSYLNTSGPGQTVKTGANASPAITITNVSGGADFSLNVYTSIATLNNGTLISANTADVSFTTVPYAPVITGISGGETDASFYFVDNLNTTKNVLNYYLNVYDLTTSTSVANYTLTNKNVFNVTDICGSHDYSFNLYSGVYSPYLGQNLCGALVSVGLPQVPVINSITSTSNTISGNFTDSSVFASGTKSYSVYATPGPVSGSATVGNFSITGLSSNTTYNVYLNTIYNNIAKSYLANSSISTIDIYITFTQRASPKLWCSICCSIDGTKLAAVVNGEYIYTSDNSGVTWTALISAGAKSWYSICCSSDGSKLAAVTYNNYIYMSTNSGVTWTHASSLSTKLWYSICCSSDGSKLAAVAQSDYIYTSGDSGVNWIRRALSFGLKSWFSICCSSNGSKLAAVAFNNYIYTSEDSGGNWTRRTSPGMKKWKSICCSSDGSKLAAVAESEYIYTSGDSGDTWTARISAGAKLWHSICCSSDGSKLAAVFLSGYIYTSDDYGDTWTSQTTGYTGTKSWTSICCSSDGTKIAAAAFDDYIYISN